MADLVKIDQIDEANLWFLRQAAGKCVKEVIQQDDGTYQLVLVTPDQMSKTIWNKWSLKVETWFGGIRYR